MSPALQEVIRLAYATFPDARLRPPLDVCKACCVTDEEERALAETPRAALPSDLLWVYLNSGVSASPSLRELRHFLPRLLELIAHFDPPGGQSVALSRLRLHPASDWAPAERAVLARFALVFFEDCLDEDGAPVFGVLQMFDRGGVDVRPLLAVWEQREDRAATEHFATFFQALARRSASPAVPHDALPATVAAWLDTPGVRERLLDRLAAILALPNEERPARLGAWAEVNATYAALWV
jgi:hypothetical protein